MSMSVLVALALFHRVDCGCLTSLWHTQWLASYMDTEEELPRVPRVQCHGSNVCWHTSFYLYLTSTVAEPFLYKHLLTSECFAESNTIFSDQTRDACRDQFELWHDDLPTPRSLDNELFRWFNMWSRQYDTADLAVTFIKSFQNIRILLVFGCTLFVTTAETKGCFSMKFTNESICTLRSFSRSVSWILFIWPSFDLTSCNYGAGALAALSFFNLNSWPLLTGSSSNLVCSLDMFVCFNHITTSSSVI